MIAARAAGGGRAGIRATPGEYGLRRVSVPDPISRTHSLGPYSTVESHDAIQAKIATDRVHCVMCVTVSSHRVGLPRSKVRDVDHVLDHCHRRQRSCSYIAES